jgi:hypothetical protein
VELQPEPARLLDRGRERPPERHRLEQHEQRARPPGERGESAEPVPHARPRDCRISPIGQVHDQQVHGSCRQERARHRECLLEVSGHEHDEPLRTHAAAHGLDRIEGTGEIQPGDDRARGLCLRREPQGERRLARARVAPQRDGRRPGQPASAEDGVERGEPGRDDPPVGIGCPPAGAGRDGRNRRRAGERNGAGAWIVSLGCLARQRLDGPREGAIRLVRDGLRTPDRGGQAKLAT